MGCRKPAEFPSSAECSAVDFLDCDVTGRVSLPLPPLRVCPEFQYMESASASYRKTAGGPYHILVEANAVDPLSTTTMLPLDHLMFV